MSLTAEDLLAGSAATHEVEVPPDVLAPGGAGETGGGRIVLRALTVRDLQRIARAAKDDAELSATLMIHHALVEPALSIEQVSQLPAGAARFIVDRVNSVSGIGMPRDELAEIVQAPLARACVVLAKEFGWTPEEVSGMTIGQILLYLETSGAGA
ncbi:MAG TPA: hypothetical protein VG318_13585 [Actinomycetota bacterium]|nr:hypothetical protein [Actinomycetota bacterium]